jgi:hydroxymethylglutaryl-CoA synthase
LVAIDESASVGISDIGIYIPPPAMAMGTLVEHRVRQNPRLERHLERACRVTGQKVIRFPEMWEDAATLAATATHSLVVGNPALDVHSIRHLAVGTETGVDHSKPMSAYVQGMLQKAGLDLKSTLSSFQVQHACAGGTMALLGVAGMLAAGGRAADCGLVVNSDIARYDTETTAEITQGAGAVALHVALAPRLLSIDLATLGFFSADVDDFFRPLGSTTARVDGGYSMKCYWDSLEAAFLDHCSRAGTKPEQALLDTDYFVLHTPFRNMPESAMEKLLGRVLGYDAARAKSFLEERSFATGVDPLARIGNIYNGSIAVALAFLLHDRYQALGEGIIGKRILLASYGSGNTMVVIAGLVQAQAPQVISRWDLGRIFSTARPATMEEYDAWTAGPVQPELQARLMENASPPQDAFMLTGIRKDGYREYTYKESGQQGHRLEERETPDDLHGSVAISG